MDPWTAQGQVLFHPLCASILHYYCDELCPRAVQRTRQGRKLNLRCSWLNVFPLAAAGEPDAVHEVKHLAGFPHQRVRAGQRPAGAELPGG